MKKIGITQTADRIRIGGRIVDSPIGPQPFVCVVIGNPDGEDIRLDFTATEFERFASHCAAFVIGVENGEIKLPPEDD